MMNNLKQNVVGDGNGITETKSELTKNTCKNITIEKKWKRNCPKCNREIVYSGKWYYDSCYKLNRMCMSCSRKGSVVNLGRSHTEETKKKISESLKGKKCYWFGKNLRDDIKKKISKTKMGTKLSEEARENISKSLLGNQYRKGTKQTEEVKEKIRNSILNDPNKNQRILKMRNSLLNHPNRNEINKKMRLSAIKRRNKYGVCFPNFNRDACEYFNWLNKWNGWSGKHAQNGGEHYIDELGYWVDYYEPALNLVIEWDEKKHFNIGGTLKEKDVNRMKEIKKFLGCRFFRVNDKTKDLKEW